MKCIYSVILGLLLCFASSLELSAAAFNISTFSSDSAIEISDFSQVPIYDFEELEGDVARFGVNDDVHYVLIENLPASFAQPTLVIENPNLGHIKFHAFDESGKLVSASVSGLNYSFDNRFKPHRFPNFMVPEAGKANTILLEIAANTQISVPISLLPLEQLYSHYSRSDMLFYAYIGIAMAMLLYNIFIFYTTRDTNYLLYVIYVITVAFAQIVLYGNFFRFVVPTNGHIANLAVFWSGGLSGLSVIIFALNFMRSKKLPWFHYIMVFFCITYSLATLVSLLEWYSLSYNLINISASIGSVFLLVGAFLISRKGYRPAKFFLVAWTLFLTGVITYVLRDVGVLGHNVFTNNALMVGSAMELILLSFALADKINYLQADREKSRKRALQAVRKNEQLVREQNVLLERKVTERTVELENANTELSETLENLQKTQVQLVDAEKMASLGQLTAGIAHEINNPINFVVGNVSPLKRDIDEIVEVLESFKEANSENGSPEKIQAALQLEKEYEVPFLVEEINSLISGIKEGASRTAEIVQGLRNFSRTDDADSQLFNVNDGIESTLVILQNIMKNDIVVEQELGDDLPNIECYPGKLNQVFANILTNSAQAISKRFEPGNSLGRIHIKTYQVGDVVKIELTDNGGGIPEEVRSKIFDPFFTTKEVGEGTGLGLSIVYSIIEAHFGRIYVTSEDNEGSTFHIELPLKLEEGALE